MLEKESLSPKKRTIKSFVKREGRLTTGQKSALENFSQKYIVQQNDFVLPAGFKHNVLEIGFGNGLSLVEQASKAPETFYLGIEVYLAGVGQLILHAADKGLDNLKVFNDDAVEVIDNALAENSFDTIQLFFPDPWHKKRHHKRRLVQVPFMAKIARLLKANGVFHVATDWVPYAEHVTEILAQCPNFKRIDATPYLNARPKTKFEARGERLGHDVTDLVFQLI